MNEDYWDKDEIYISRINYNYNKEAKTLAPELFLRGEVSEADIPAEILDEWINDDTRKNMLIEKPSSTSRTSWDSTLNRFTRRSMIRITGARQSTTKTSVSPSTTQWTVKRR